MGTGYEVKFEPLPFTEADRLFMNNLFEYEQTRNVILNSLRLPSWFVNEINNHVKPTQTTRVNWKGEGF